MKDEGRGRSKENVGGKNREEDGEEGGYRGQKQGEEGRIGREEEVGWRKEGVEGRKREGGKTNVGGQKRKEKEEEGGKGGV